VTPQQIAWALATRPADELWKAFLTHVRTLQPFWEGATHLFAERCSLPEKRRDTYLGVIAGAFQKMDDWRLGRVKPVKARRNEIDGAISFLRNKAIERPVCDLRIAPAARNSAGALRALLSTSCHDYDDQQLPEVVASALYDIAAVRTLFPFDFGNLTLFHPGHSVAADIDPFVVMLERAGKEIGIEGAVESLTREVTRMWDQFHIPAPLVFTDGYWSVRGGDADSRLHYAAIALFHRQS
jgi:hypothetical protein